MVQPVPLGGPAAGRKWYNLFLSVDQPPGEGGAPEDSAPTAKTPAQTVAEIASSVAAEPKFSSPVSAAAGFDEIYHAAEIQPPAARSITPRRFSRPRMAIPSRR